MQIEWQEEGCTAEYFAPYLCLTDPKGATGLVQLHNAKGRNVTRQQFAASVKTHGAERACQTFWKLRA